jgi:hypothetical protein
VYVKPIKPQRPSNKKEKNRPEFAGRIISDTFMDLSNGGWLRTKDSVGGTPTGAVGTTALPGNLLMIWVDRDPAFASARLEQGAETVA